MILFCFRFLAHKDSSEYVYLLAKIDELREESLHESAIGKHKIHSDTLLWKHLFGSTYSFKDLQREKTLICCRLKIELVDGKILKTLDL